MIYIALTFITVAFLYASVGFGGGSTYTAVLIESGMAYNLVPPVSLLCNIVVAAGGDYRMYYAACDRDGNWRIASAVRKEGD